MSKKKRSRRRSSRDDQRSAGSQARREELLDAAVRAIRSEGPGVSMEQVAAAAGVTKPILYRHVGDRSALVNGLAERFVAELTDELLGVLDVEADPRQTLVAMIDTYLQVVERDTDLYRFLVMHALADQEGAEKLVGVMEQIAQQVAVVIGEQLRAAGLDSGPAELWAQALVGMVHTAGDWWLDRRTLPRARVVEYLAQLVWDGMGGLGFADADGALTVRTLRDASTPEPPSRTDDAATAGEAS